MKRFLLVIAVSGLVACQPSSPEGIASDGTASDGTTADALVESEVATFLDAYASALENRDTLLLPAMYVADGRFEWLEDGVVRYRSADEVLTSLASFPAEARIHTEYTDPSIRSVGTGVAVASMTFATTIGEGQGGFHFGGVISMVLERDTVGWKIVAGHTSTANEGGR